MAYRDNLAYDLDFEANAARREKKVKERQRENKARKKAERSRLYRVIFCCLSAIALCAGFMISRNVTAYESKCRVEELQKELKDLKEISSQKTYEFETSIDREEIEREAKERFNMVRPEKCQMVYVNVKQDDVTEVTASDNRGIKSFFDIFASKK